MNLEIRGLGLEPSRGFRRHIERRLRRSLHSFDGRVERISVRLVQEQGGGGGVIRCCHLTVLARGLEPIHVEERHGSVDVAFARAARRAKQRVARAVERRRRVHPSHTAFDAWDLQEAASAPTR